MKRKNAVPADLGLDFHEWEDCGMWAVRMILLFLLSVAVMTFYGDDVYQHYGVVDSVYYPIFFVNPSGPIS